MNLLFTSASLLLARATFGSLPTLGSPSHFFDALREALPSLDARVSIRYVLLAQTSMDAPLHSVVDFLAKVALLSGICVIIAGGVKISRGDTEGGLMAIVGGVLIALAVPIMKFLLSLAGINF